MNVGITHEAIQPVEIPAHRKSHEAIQPADIDPIELSYEATQPADIDPVELSHEAIQPVGSDATLQKGGESQNRPFGDILKETIQTASSPGRQTLMSLNPMSGSCLDLSSLLTEKTYSSSVLGVSSRKHGV